MSLSLILYWINVLANIDTFMKNFFYISLIYLIISGFITLLNRDISKGNEASILIQKQWFLNPLKYYFWIPCLLLLISAFIPSQKTMYLMIGSEYLKNSAIPTKVEIILNKKLDEYISDKPKDENK